ncbi:MAG: thioredoxin family protein [Bacteroidota bacterium]
MKRLATAITFLSLIFSSLAAQVVDPVHWDFSWKQTGDREAELIFSAKIDKPWHLYSANLPAGGPIATRPSYDDSAAFTLSGGIIEVIKPKVKFDEGFQMNVGTLERTAEFRQKIILKDRNALTITGEIEYQVCDDMNCLPPKQDPFTFKISLAAPASETAAAVAPSADTGKTVTADEGDTVKAGETLTAAGQELPSVSTPAMEEEKSIWGFFWFAFGAGLLALLTPCVFPMIPMTVSFFMRGNDKRSKGVVSASVFGLSIIGIYTLLGVLVSLTNMSPEAANNLSTHWIPNTIFFILFLVFAFSFLGMFELVLPSSWVNRADSQVDRGGLGGAFFMALTTVLVSFSCTGPFVGALLVEAVGGLALKPILGMFGFGLAFAIPFTLFALFPSWLESMPKSGGWLNAIKVVLGFVVLAFGMKFLLPLDPYHRVLTRELYLAVWIVLAFLLGMYFLGKIRFAHDSEQSHVTVPRLMLALATFTFVIYLFMGLFGAELKLVAPLMPPKSSHGIDLTRPAAFAPVQASDKEEECTPVKHVDLFSMPAGYSGFFDLEEGLACAKASGKPVLIDFKGHSCSNCKKMEAAVWSDPAVRQLLNERFVIVALYTDDRTKLPESEWYVSRVDGKEKKTIGQQSIDYEIEHFRTNTVPLYVIMDSNGKVLNQPKGTDLDVASYMAWLNEGLAAAGK